MKIQTFSIVVGGNMCNANCPYCVSKLTGKSTCGDRLEDINERNFHKACQFAKMSGVSTVLLTGKGEPLLYPDHIGKYLHMLKKYEFPFIELQTNGIRLLEVSSPHLNRWYNLGLTTVSLSCASWDTLVNKRIYSKKYQGVFTYSRIAHDAGFSVRISCVMLKNEVGNRQRVEVFAGICNAEGVEQFTVRPVANYSDGDNQEVSTWIEENRPDSKDILEMQEYFEYNAYLLLELAHGAKVYDYKGQNISINTCLTHRPDPNDIRQLIYFPDGKLMYDWVHKGAIII